MFSDGKKLDDQTLHFFESALAGPGKALHVRRYIQIIQDVLRKPANEINILDLACGEGIYALESALHGCHVLAIDGRIQRMGKAIETANRLGLENVRFEQNDIRNVTVASHGHFHVVLAIGIVYHLDGPSLFPFLQNVYEISSHMVLIDTLTTAKPDSSITHGGHVYDGIIVREHKDSDSNQEKKERVLASLDNPYSFILSKQSLISMLSDVGFTSVFECHTPEDPYRKPERITLVALKGNNVQVFSYPWVNDRLGPKMLDVFKQARNRFRSTDKRPGHYGLVRSLLRRFRFDLRRVDNIK